jgi:predicted metal-dependent hydrolase
MDIKTALLSKKKNVDINRLTPQSMYYGTAEYYKEKLGSRLPEIEYEILEIQQKKLSEEYIEYVKQQAIDEFNRLMNEFEERANEGKDEIPIENLNITENFFVAS